MTKKELLYIKTIADEGSISKAAKKLYITQPSLSHCVQRIEEKLGTKLFVRSAGGLLLTYAGKRYYSVAIEILRLYNDFEIEISEIGDLKKGRITVGITNYLGTWVLPKVLPDFKRLYPNIRVVPQEQSSDELEKSLDMRHLDFAVMHIAPNSIEQSSPEITYSIIHRDPFVVVAPSGSGLSSLAKPSPHGGLPILDVKDIIDQPFVTVTRGKRIRQVTDAIFYKLGAAPNIILATQSFETARRLCAQGYGITFISWEYSRIFQDDIPVEYYAIDESYMPYWDLCIALPKDYYVTKASQALIQMIKEKMGTEPLISI